MIEIHVVNDLPKPIKKIAAFDIDGTIIETKSGSTFPKDQNDWQFLYGGVATKLNQLDESGYLIVFFTNQNGIGTGKQDEKEWITKINNIISELKLNNIVVYAATENDMFRKPSIGMWDAFVKKYNIDVKSINKKSFYCGDAAGRIKNWHSNFKKDFSDTDRKFALNINLQFYTPEELFLNWEPTKKYELSGFQPAELIKYYNDDNNDNIVDFLQKDNNYLILTVGYPGSGKSHLSSILNKQFDIQIVNQDLCKTNSKCLKLCKQFIDANKSVVIDNTNPTKEIRKKYIDLVGKKHYKIICLNVTTSMEISQHNSKYRNYATNNDVAKIPDVVYYTFRKKYEEPTLDEGFYKIINIPFVLSYKMPPEYFMYY